MNSTYISTSESQVSSIDEWTWSFRTILVFVVCSLITILTILGNGLVLISVKYRFHARSYSDYFIVSLCLADFFVGLFVMPLMTIHSLYLRWPFDYRLCYLWMSIDFTCSTASFLTLASMALDRYYALTAPYFHLRNRSYSSVLICIISSWIIPFAIWPSSILVAHQFNTNEPACVHPARPFIIVILCTFFYYIPLLFMLICYSRIIVNIKNIEVLIKGTWGTGKFDPIDCDSQVKSKDKNSHLRNSLSQSNVSFCSIILRYFHRNSPKSTRENSSNLPDSNKINHSIRQGTITHHAMTPKTLIPMCHHRPHRHTTTATFTGQKRCVNELNDDHRSKPDLLINPDEEQLVRARLSTRTSSLPAARCISYYCYHQNSTPTQGRISDEQQRSRVSSITNDRSRSQSHSSSQGLGNGAVLTPDISEHSSSFENNLDEEHRRLNRRNQPLRSSTYNSSRYSQRAIAQFMHERHKARLRRNQKASRMLGILLAVFLICWLPFTLSYPTMIFYPNKFPPLLESIIFWFGYINSALNPFLYVYSSRNFRQAIVETLCCYARFRTRQHLRYQWSLRN